MEERQRPRNPQEGPPGDPPPGNVEQVRREAGELFARGDSILDNSLSNENVTAMLRANRQQGGE
jgi:hypothetical protein